MNSAGHSERGLVLEHEDPWWHAMLCGDFASAWRISDAVLERRRQEAENCADWPRHLQFIWNGAPVDGRRVLVRCYHGLGDTIQFVRFARRLRRRASEVTLWAQPALITLLEGVAGIDRVLPLHDGEPELEYDVDLELMEVPHALRLELEDVAVPLPYVRAPAAPPLRQPRDVRHVGIMWRSGDWDPARSIPEALLKRWARIPDVRWYSLQYGVPGAPPLGAPFARRDLLEMAARMQSLDLIISVDTYAAHLAGALGLPVWTLLRARCDWRWMYCRSDSPWYPTMRLFRQPSDGDWVSVVEDVARTLSSAGSSLPPAPGIRSTGCRAFSD